MTPRETADAARDILDEFLVDYTEEELVLVLALAIVRAADEVGYEAQREVLLEQAQQIIADGGLDRGD
jgi:hypothetical protein